MTVGSTANLAFAMDTLRTWRADRALGPLHRLILVLISDRFGAGATFLDVGKLHHLVGSDDPTDVRNGLIWLAKCGLVRLSRFERGDDRAFAGSTLATETEIAAARAQFGCSWPFHNWAGEP